jgi:adenylylsulfate kinase-like enzyme
MTGVGQTYEPPEHPDLVVSGAGDVEESVALLLEALEVVH